MCEEDEQLFTTSQAAKFLDVSDSSVKRWIDSGKIPARKTAGGHRRISSIDLADFRATFYPGIESDKPIKTKKLNWASDAAMVTFFRESMVSGDPYSMEKAIRSRKEYSPSYIFDHFLYPAYLEIREGCHDPDPNCNIASRSMETTKKCVSFLQKPAALHRKKMLMLADIGGHLDGIPTFLAEACAYGHYSPAQLGASVKAFMVERGLREFQPQLLFLSGKGGNAESCFGQILEHMKDLNIAIPLLTMHDSDFADRADRVFQTFSDLHDYLKINQ